jgi:hypothetical protein
MAYIMMLVADDTDQLNAILHAWESIHVDDVVFMDSTSFHRAGIHQPHIPMRFMFERLEHRQYQSSVVLLGIATDEAMVEQCLAQVETVIGDLDADQNAIFVAWPLPIVKGFPKRTGTQGEAVE